VWSGSHLDSVPGGGRFDGALGVLAALEAVAVLGSTPLAAPLAVVAFRDEEGWRFGRGFFGSRAVSGRVTEDELESADADGVRVRDALDELGLEGPPVAGPLPGTFVEVHVEQGPVLERTATGHAVVSSIAGKHARTIAALSSREPFSTTTTRSGSAQLRSDSRQPRSNSHVLKETITTPIEVIAAASVAGVAGMCKCTATRAALSPQHLPTHPQSDSYSTNFRPILIFRIRMLSLTSELTASDAE